MRMIHAAAAILTLGSNTVSHAQTPLDPTFLRCGQMVGGVWVGSMGKLKIELKFHYEQNKNVIVGHAIIGKGSKNPVMSDSRFGWDAAQKKVYYLDCHGAEVVYLGHVENDGDGLKFTFDGLIGDKGHYLTLSKFNGPNQYEFSMWEVTNGKMSPEHIDVTYHRQG